MQGFSRDRWIKDREIERELDSEATKTSSKT
jgi:hypothetical protein